MTWLAVINVLSAADGFFRISSPLTGLTSELERERRKDDMAMADPSSNPYMMPVCRIWIPPFERKADWVVML